MLEMGCTEIDRPPNSGGYRDSDNKTSMQLPLRLKRHYWANDLGVHLNPVGRGVEVVLAASNCGSRPLRDTENKSLGNTYARTSSF